MAADDRIDLPGHTPERTLGRTEHADIHLYAQHEPRRRVAVTVLRRPVASRADRYRFDALTAAVIALPRHPSIVPMHTAGIAGDGRAYVVTAYCPRPGPAALARAQPLSVSEVCRTMVQVAAAVEAAHTGGVLHGDITPARLATTDAGAAALDGFGLAVLTGASAAWASPEAVRGREIDPRADVYALASTTYGLLAGSSPFDGVPADHAALLARVLATVPPPVPRADVPDALQRLLRAGMAKRPEERPDTAAEFAHALQEIERELGRTPTPLGSEVTVDSAMERTILRPPAAPAARPPRVAEPLPVTRPTRVAPPSPDGAGGTERTGGTATRAVHVPGMEPVEAAAYGIRTPAEPDPVVRTPEPDPHSDTRTRTPTPPAARPGSRRGLLLTGVGVGLAAVVAAAGWGIALLLGG
jgi:serine/threonine protein kinase